MTIHPVSVIIPTFNRQQLLSRAIQSVLQQTAQPAELIIVDDGSDDGTDEIVAALQEKSSTSIRYRHTENRGVAAARNLGIQLSRYKYLAFLDSDDHWQRKKLETQLKAMQAHEQYLVSHTYEKWLRRGVHLNQKKKHIPKHGDIFAQCLQLCAVGMSTVMINRQLFSEVGRFDERYRCCEDYDFWLRVSSRFGFLLVAEPLTVKEGGRPDQLSSRFRMGMDKLRIEAIESLLDAGTLSRNQMTLANNELVKKCRVYGGGCLKHGKESEGRYYLEKAEVILQHLEQVEP